MKYLFIVALLAAVVLAGLVACKNLTKQPMGGKPAPTGALVNFHYQESGTMAQPNFEYTLRRGEAGEVTLYAFRPFAEVEGWGDTLTVQPEVLDHVERLIKDNNLQNYKEHYQPKMEVMDGYGWSYEAVFDNGTRLHSGGSNARPSDGTLTTIAHYLDSIYQDARK